jgi:hypothetical protein
MSAIDQLGVALGLSTLAGLTLYLTVLVAGCAVRFHWLDLAGNFAGLEILANPWVLGAAAGMYLVEFLADKIPWVDSVWDVAHAVIRPAGGIFLALAAMGKMDPVAQSVAVMLAGGAALSTHGVKSGVRALLNLSPEPVSNSIASVTEDGVVLGGLGLIAAAPAVALVLFIALSVSCAAIAIWLWKRIFRFARRRRDSREPQPG